MSLIDIANEECQRLRELANPYTAPELFHNPPIQSNQVKAALFAVDQALTALKKQYTSDLTALKKQYASGIIINKHKTIQNVSAKTVNRHRTLDK